MKRAPNPQAGFSILELIVAMGVMLVVLGVTSSLMKDSLTVSTTTHEMLEAQQSLRIAQDYIAGDLIQAGDGTRSLGDIRLPIQFVMDNLSSRDAESLDPDRDDHVSLGVVFPDNDSPAGATINTPEGAINVMPGQDRLTLMLQDRTFDPISLFPGSITNSGSNVSIPVEDVGRFQQDEIYFFSCGTAGAFGAVTNVGGETGNSPNIIFADSDPYGLNDPGNGGPINVASDRGNRACTLMRVNLVHYFVNSDGLLMKRVFGGAGAAFKDIVVTEHLTNLQFRYALNQAGGVTVVDSPTTPAEMSAVRLVDVAVEVETVHRVAGGEKAEVRSSSQTALRNLQYRAAGN